MKFKNINNLKAEIEHKKEIKLEEKKTKEIKPEEKKKEETKPEKKIEEKKPEKKRNSLWPPLTRKQIVNLLQGPYTYESKKKFIYEFTGGKGPRSYFYLIYPRPPEEELKPEQPIPVESPKNHKFCEKRRRKKKNNTKKVMKTRKKIERKKKERKRRKKEEKED